MEELINDLPAEPENDILKELLGDYSDVPLSFDEPKTESNSAPESVSQPTQAETVDPAAPFGRFENGKPRKRRPKGSISPNERNDTNQTVLVSDLISGTLCLTLIDLLLPLLIELINNRVSKDKIKAGDLQMTAEQRKRLTPIFDELAKRWNITAHPGVLALIGLTGIYGMNFAMLKFEVKQEKDIERGKIKDT